MQHYFVFHTSNQDTASALQGSLSAAGVAFHSFPITDQPEDAHRLGALPDLNGPIILLVTDNFLKSPHCMRDALVRLRRWNDAGNLFPVIAEGRQLNAEGNWETTPTTFDRVSNIIAYMNFWQDQYLELRREKRQHEDAAQLDERIESTKEVSAEIGEFLRYLRNMETYTPETLAANDFQALKTGMLANAKFTPKPGRAPLDAPVPVTSHNPNVKSLAELIQDSSEELMAENVELENTPPAPAEAADLSFHLEDIPALPSLPKEEKQAGPLVSQYLISKENKGEATPDDAGDDDIDTILQEALNEDTEAGDFSDPGMPDFDLQSIFDEEEEAGVEPARSAYTPAQETYSDEEVMLDLVPDDEEGLVINADGKGLATPEEVLEHAILLYDDGNAREALEYLQKTVELNENDNTLRYYYAYALASYGRDFESAHLQLDAILKQDDRHTDALFLKAEMAENKGEYELAKRHYETVATLQPSYPDVYLRLGKLSLQQHPGEEQEAAAWLERAVEYDPENVDALYALGSLMNDQMDNSENAIPYFQRVLKYDTAHPFANYDLAVIHYDVGHFDLAKNYFEKAIAINPELDTAQNRAAFDARLQRGLTDDHADENALQSEILPETGNSVHIISEEEASGQALNADSPQEAEAAEAVFFPSENEEGTPEKVMTDLEIPNEPATNTQTEDRTDTLALAETETAPLPPLVLITGGTSGIGRATAELFAASGYRVIITGRRAERLAQLREEWHEKFRAEVETLQFDVRDLAAVQQAIETLPEAWRNVDILINNAGLSRGLAPIHEGDVEHWETMIDTNIKGLLYLTRAIAPQMVARRSGHIINVASSAGKEVYPGGNVYSATKFAVDSLTKSMRLDLYTHGVRVSQVAPGHVEETEFASVRFDGDTERAAQVYENFQPLRASDVAEVIYFIATRPAHVTVQDVLVYGTQQAGSNFIDRSGR